MKNIPLKTLLVLFTLLFSISCLSEDKPIDDVNTLRPNVNENSNLNISNSDANIVEDNEVELREKINLPYEPIGDSPWQEDTKSVPNKLKAVLKFSEEDTQKLLEKVRGANKSLAVSIDAESWFPAELIAKSDSTGDTTLKGIEYSATDFVKSPYSEGNLIFIDGADFFVLNLQTK
ncbi:MAG: hypothetical protein M3405_08435 [Acidobacteriota bacterium]|jgi:hypothetical protein|nr:hypothetical protein [Acidobacteriota bacterium]